MCGFEDSESNMGKSHDSIVSNGGGGGGGLQIRPHLGSRIRQSKLRSSVVKKRWCWVSLEYSLFIDESDVASWSIRRVVGF